MAWRCGTPFAAGALPRPPCLWVPLYGLSGTQHEAVYSRSGTPFVGEFYADLDYGADGFLVITREHAAVDPGSAARRVLRLSTKAR